MRFERERKNGRRVRKKKGVVEKRKWGWYKIPCWVFVLSGRWHSTICLARLEHPRFFSGADVWPPRCYGLSAVISAAVHVVAKHHENN